MNTIQMVRRHFEAVGLTMPESTVTVPVEYDREGEEELRQELSAKSLDLDEYRGWDYR